MSDPPNDIDALIDTLRKGTDHLRAMASSMEFPWNPDLDDPRKLHNMYARNLICAYVSKWSDLSTGILHAIEHSHFLTYALCGRALIETTAMLRYYVLQEYKPLLDKGSLNAEDKRKLIEIDDRHLRGSRFDWQSFLYRRYAKLKADAVAHFKQQEAKEPDNLRSHYCAAGQCGYLRREMGRGDT